MQRYVTEDEVYHYSLHKATTSTTTQQTHGSVQIWEFIEKYHTIIMIYS